MLVLGVETSCDDTGVALVEDGSVCLADVTSRQDDLHARFGGVVPEVASRCHSERLTPLVEGILREADVTYRDLDAVAYTEGPGLIGSLLVGSNFGKSLAYGLGIPCVGVHHLEAHLFSVSFAAEEVPFPHLGLLVSGGHTSLCVASSWTQFESLGETLDDAAGEAFDKVAKILGFGYPGGPAIERAAASASGPFPELPSPRTQRPYDISLSGLKSAVARLARSDTFAHDNIAAAFQTVVVSMLVKRAIGAARETGIGHVTLCGGVAANGFLRERLAQACRESDLSFTPAPLRLAMDNGVMVAGLGAHLIRSGKRATLDAGAFSTVRPKN